MTTPCYPIPGPSAAAGSAARAHTPHVHLARHDPGVGQSAHHHVPVHHGPVHHAPVYGPPPPTVAANCVRIPGELPAFPGAPILGTGVTQAGTGIGSGPAAAVAGTGPASVAGALGGGALGLAKAAMVAAGLGLAAAGATAFLPTSPAPANNATSSTLATPTDTTPPGLPFAFLPLPPTPATVRSTSQPTSKTQDTPAGPDKVSPPGTPAAVPEPGTISLLAAGALIVFAGHRHIRRRARKSVSDQLGV